MGLMPRKAENKLPMAGMWLMAVAWARGTPCWVSPVSNDLGNDAESPSVMTVKKKPIESTDAEFWKVFNMAPPAPRRLAGSEFMTAEEFGAAKRPIDSPTSNKSAANNG